MADGENQNFRMGGLTEAVESMQKQLTVLPDIAKDMAEVKTRLELLPCTDHTERVAALETQGAGISSKMAILWAMVIVGVSTIINHFFGGRN